MAELPRRVGLSSIMIAVAALAVAFACLGVPGGSVAAVVFGVTSVPILICRPGRRLGAWALVFSLYPTLLLGCLYLTWGSAWGVVGHRPRLGIEGPGRVGPVVAGAFVATNFLVFGLPFSFLGCLLLSTAESKRRFVADGRRGRGFLPPLAGPVGWLAAFGFLRWDPFDVLAWFLA